MPEPQPLKMLYVGGGYAHVGMANLGEFHEVAVAEEDRILAGRYGSPSNVGNNVYTGSIAIEAEPAVGVSPNKYEGFFTSSRILTNWLVAKSLAGQTVRQTFGGFNTNSNQFMWAMRPNSGTIESVEMCGPLSRENVHSNYPDWTSYINVAKNDWLAMWSWMGQSCGAWDEAKMANHGDTEGTAVVTRHSFARDFWRGISPDYEAGAIGLYEVTSGGTFRVYGLDVVVKRMQFLGSAPRRRPNSQMTLM